MKRIEKTPPAASKARQPREDTKGDAPITKQTERKETVEIRYVTICGKEVMVIGPGQLHDKLKRIQDQVEDALSTYSTLDWVNHDLAEMLGELSEQIHLQG